MEEAVKFIWATTCLIFVSVNSNAHESIEETTAPSYWGCLPVYVEIDYSYLRVGEWIGEELREKIRVTFAKIHNQPNDVEGTWGLVNCIN